MAEEEQKSIISPTPKGLNFPLIFAASSAQLLSFTAGNALAWTSPVLPKLNSTNPDENPFGYRISSLEESWIASLLNLGSAVGPLIGGALVNRIGRKKTMLGLAVPMITSFIILAFGTSPIYYYFARFILGLGVGCVYSLVPMYIGEIAEDSNRGALGCLLGIMAALGAIYSSGAGPYISIKLFCLLSIIPLAAFVVCFGMFAPESPYYLVLVGRENEARSALTRIRHRDDNLVEKELQKVVNEVENSVKNSQNQNLSELFKSKIVRKGLIIGISLMLLQQISGLVIIASYMQSIFEAAGNTIPPKIASVAVGGVQLVSNFVTSSLVEKLGRKFLLLLSLSLAVLSNAGLGTFFFLTDSGYDTEYIFWIPTASVMVYYVGVSLGIGGIPWVVVSEIFPSNIKSAATTIVSVCSLMFAFLASLAFPSVVDLVGLPPTFTFFSGGCIAGVIFVALVVPETKGKSLQEIQIMLGQGQNT